MCRIRIRHFVLLILSLVANPLLASTALTASVPPSNQPWAETGDPHETELIDQGLAAYKRGDYATALKLWRPLARKGVPRAQNNLGALYDKGRGVPQNFAEAVKWYRKAAKQGHPKAHHNLGLKYARGEGVRQNQAEALQLFRQAAERGDAEAQNRLGWELSYGKGGRRDHKQGVDWFHKAAEQGNAAAFFNLGLAYENGRGVTRDLALARYWFDQAAAQYPSGQWKRNSVSARERVSAVLQGKSSSAARKYKSDRGDRKKFKQAFSAYKNKNYTTAFKLWHQVGQRGHYPSQYNVGLMYAKGEGVAKDYKKAAEWYLRAANQGSTDAQYHFARELEWGRGLDYDLERAQLWYDQAAKNYPAGEKRQKAIEASKRMAQHIRDGTLPGIKLAQTVTASRDFYYVNPHGAWEKLDGGQYRLALSGFNRAIKMMEDKKQNVKDSVHLVEVYIGRIKALIGLGKTDKADGDVLKLARSGSIYFRSHEELRIEAMTRLLQKEPRNLEYLTYREDAYVDNKQYDKYRDDTTRRIQYASTNEERADAYSSRSFAYALLKQPKGLRKNNLA